MSQPGADDNQLFIQLCSDHLSFEAIPRKPLIVDLGRIRATLLESYEILMMTPQFVVLRNKNGHEVTLRRDGRMVVRNAGSEETARRTAASVLSLALSGFRE